MLDEAGIAAIVNLLRAAAPDAEVFLFGSYARGAATDRSDLDLLVVEPIVNAAASRNRPAETAPWGSRAFAWIC